MDLVWHLRLRIRWIFRFLRNLFGDFSQTRPIERVADSSTKIRELVPSPVAVTVPIPLQALVPTQPPAPETIKDEAPTPTPARKSEVRVPGTRVWVWVAPLLKDPILTLDNIEELLKVQFGRYGHAVKKVHMDDVDKRGFCLLEFTCYDGMKAAVDAWTGGPPQDGPLANMDLHVKIDRRRGTRGGKSARMKRRAMAAAAAAAAGAAAAN